LKIAQKLDAQKITTRSDEHDEYGVFHEEQLIASFGVRRSSRKDKGCGHVPGELGVGPNFAKQLAQCTKYREDYLKRVGQIQEDENDAESK